MAARSEQAAQYHRLYRTARWQKLRNFVLVRDHYRCTEPGCGVIQTDTSKLIAHHHTPHRGDEGLFFDADNVRTVCKPCHDGHIQSLEAGGQGRAIIGLDGWPVA